MGLLDDAIREHLELKRRRGADPIEVARQESEALGPVRRGEPPFAEAAGPAVAEHDEERPAPAVHEHEYHEPPPAPVEYEPPPDPSERMIVEPPAEPAPPPLEAPPAPPAAAAPPPEPATREHAPPSPEPRPHGDLLDPQRTAEFSADEVTEATTPPAPEQPPLSPEPPPHGDEVVPADDEGSDDVLDQTPDFLQETPEHDRLWFEQKPPKDFDF